MVAVWFLWDGEKFLIFSQPNTQKLRNLRHNSHVTLALDDTHSGGDVLVIDGEAELLTDPDVNATLISHCTHGVDIHFPAGSIDYSQ